MSHRMISFAVIALLGFAALPAEAHIASGFVAPAQIEMGRIGFIAQGLEKILPDIINVEPEHFYTARYELDAPVVAQPSKDDSDGVSL